MYGSRVSTTVLIAVDRAVDPCGAEPRQRRPRRALRRLELGHVLEGAHDTHRRPAFVARELCGRVDDAHLTVGRAPYAKLGVVPVPSREQLPQGLVKAPAILREHTGLGRLERQRLAGLLRGRWSAERLLDARRMLAFGFPAAHASDVLRPAQPRLLLQKRLLTQHNE